MRYRLFAQSGYFVPPEGRNCIFVGKVDKWPHSFSTGFPNSIEAVGFSSAAEMLGNKVELSRCTRLSAASFVFWVLTRRKWRSCFRVFICLNVWGGGEVGLDH